MGHSSKMWLLNRLKTLNNVQIAWSLARYFLLLQNHLHWTPSGLVHLVLKEYYHYLLDLLMKSLAQRLMTRLLLLGIWR